MEGDFLIKWRSEVSCWEEFAVKAAKHVITGFKLASTFGLNNYELMYKFIKCDES